MLTKALVCGAMAGARLGELAWSRRNVAASGPATEGRRSARTYPLIVMLHASVIAGTFVFGGSSHWRWLLVLTAAQALRLWVLATLGKRWNVRAAVPIELEVATGGPYRWIRHPNYAVIVVELVALPLAFGLRWLALLATVLNALLLGARIPEEEAALERAPDYLEQFRHKARFIPGVW